MTQKINPTYRKIGERLKQLRENANKTQQEMADIVHVTDAQICYIEKGQWAPSIEVLKAYNKEFKVPFEYLLCNSNNREYGNIDVGYQLGLGDKFIERLKFMNNVRNNQKKYLDMINFIFTLGIDFELWETLYNYFFTDFTDELFKGKPHKILGGELVDIKCSLEMSLGNIEPTNYLIPLRNLDSLNKQMLLDRLQNIKEELNNQNSVKNLSET